MSDAARVLSCANGCVLPDGEPLFDLGGEQYHAVIVRPAYFGPNPTPSEAEPCGPVAPSQLPGNRRSDEKGSEAP